MKENDKIHKSAVAAGCKPEFSRGIFGLAWRCTCDDNRHGMDQQCSDISLESAKRGKRV